MKLDKAMNNLKRRILIIGSGHGFQSAKVSMEQSKFACDFIDESLFTKSQVLKKIDEWIVRKDDIIISSSFREKIPKSFLTRATFLNIHYALFPKYRGMHSIVWAILNGEKHIGITVHYMSDLFDQGNIIYQKKIRIRNRNSYELMKYCDEFIERNLAFIVKRYLFGVIIERKQDDRKAIYVGKRNIDDCEIKWNLLTCKDFYLMSKALVAPYPVPFFYRRGEKIEVLKSRCRIQNYKEIPGRIVNINDESVWVKLVDGVLELDEIIVNGNKIRATDFFKIVGERIK